MVIKPKTFEEKERPKLKLEKSFFILLEILIVLLLVLGLLGVYSAFLNGKIKFLKKEIEALEKERDLELEKEIKSNLSYFEKIKPLLENQASLSPILDFLEKNTLPNIKVSKFIFEIQENNLEKNKLLLDLFGLTYSSLFEQVSIYKKQEGVQDVRLSGVKSTDLGPIITLEITFLPQKIRYFPFKKP